MSIVFGSWNVWKGDAQQSQSQRQLFRYGFAFSTKLRVLAALAAKEVMELRFSSWYHWKSRNDYPGIAFPGIYVVLISEANVAGQPFSINDDVIYVGMTNAVAGLRGRLSQFDNTIAQRHCQHGGADRVLYKHQDYASLVSKLYVALWHVECTPAAETPMDLRAMGKICNAEYEVMAQCVEELGELPEFNRKKERPKFSLTHVRR